MRPFTYPPTAPNTFLNSSRCVVASHFAQPREGDDAERRPDDEQDAEEPYEHNATSGARY